MEQVVREIPEIPDWGMVDLHGHWLPGVDDGAKTPQQALNMARIAVADGIVVAAMTPHHLNGVYSNPAGKIRELLSVFAGALECAGIELTVVPGAECHLVPELPTAVRDGTALTVADRGRVLLVELPTHSIPVGATDLLAEILLQGVQPMIVHPERNHAICKRPEILAEWIELGCLAQVTAQSCTGRFGAQTRDVAEHLVRQGWIHVMASDAHRDRRRIPQLSLARAAVAQWTSPELATWLVEDAPRALVRGEPLDTDVLRTLLPRPRRWWRFGRSRAGC